MSISGLEVFDRTVQETNIWLGEIEENLGGADSGDGVFVSRRTPSSSQ